MTPRTPWRLATAFLLALPSLAYAQFDFQHPRFIKSDPAPVYLKSGDFDDDARPDLAYLTREDDRIHVVFNNANGDYTLWSWQIRNVDNITDFNVGDFDEDGKDDIILAEAKLGGGGSSKIVLLTSVGRSFTESNIAMEGTEDYATGVIPTYFDNDEHLDFLLADSFDSLKVFRGDGDGSFTSEVVADLYGISRYSANIDVNNDQKPDIVNLSLGMTLQVFINTGSGYAKSELEVGPAADMRVHDFDGDFLPDVMVSFFDGNDNDERVIRLYKNPGNGTFTNYQELLFVNPGILNHGDFDRDGREDVLIESQFPLRVLHNTTGGFQQIELGNEANNSFGGMIFADLYNDGDQMDEVIISRRADIQIHKYIGNNQFVLVHTIYTTFSSSRGTLVDLNKDGHVDIVSEAGLTSAFYINYGKGNFEFDTARYIPQKKKFYFYPPLVGDFNKDEYDDIICMIDDKVSIMLSDNGSFDEATTIEGPNAFNAKGDFNNDGNLDFVNQQFVYLGDGAGNFSIRQNANVPEILTMTTGNFNDDEFPDMLLGGFDGKVYLSLNNGTEPFFDNFTEVTDGAIVSAGDINGDGFSDFAAMEKEYTTTFRVYINEGDATFSGQDVTWEEEDNVFTTLPRFFDLDNDGSDEILAPSSMGNTGAAIAIYDFVEESDLTKVGTTFLPPDTRLFDVTAGDINGDGKMDMLGFGLGEINNFILIPAFTEPTVPPHDMTTRDITDVAATVYVQGGDGSGRVIFIRKDGVSDFLPIDNIQYEPDPVYGSGTGPFEGVFTIMRSDAPYVRVTGLDPETKYVATAFEYAETSDGMKINYFLGGAAEVIFTTKKVQTIEFTSPGNRVVGSETVNLIATTSSGLTPTFTALTDNITVTFNDLDFVAPGPATLQVSVGGNPEYAPAEIEVDFCVLPLKPEIEIVSVVPPLLNVNVEENYQWFANGHLVVGVPQGVFNPREDGVYTVKVDYSGCTNTSDPTPYIIAGVREETTTIGIYPNPARDLVTIAHHPITGVVSFIDNVGRVQQMPVHDKTINISNLSRGFYVVEVLTESGPVRSRLLIK